MTVHYIHTKEAKLKRMNTKTLLAIELNLHAKWILESVEDLIAINELEAANRVIALIEDIKTVSRILNDR